MILIGIDLAWGDKKRDGVCVMRVTKENARVLNYHYPLGDDELIEIVQKISEKEKGVLITIDAPIVCPNRTGTRPVDRLTHRMFHKEHAACHPAYLDKCPRPARVLARLKKIGFEAGWNISTKKKIACEVYPHPAMVRLFQLPRIIKYKKGNVLEKRKEFQRLQQCIVKCLKKHFPKFKMDTETKNLLQIPWKKDIEDRVDAFFCALIALWHFQHNGNKSQIIGDLKTGFILLPQ